MGEVGAGLATGVAWDGGVCDVPEREGWMEGEKRQKAGLGWAFAGLSRVRRREERREGS